MTCYTTASLLIYYSLNTHNIQYLFSELYRGVIAIVRPPLLASRALALWRVWWTYTHALITASRCVGVAGRLVTADGKKSGDFQAGLSKSTRFVNSRPTWKMTCIQNVIRKHDGKRLLTISSNSWEDFQSPHMAGNFLTRWITSNF